MDDAVESMGEEPLAAESFGDAFGVERPGGGSFGDFGGEGEVDGVAGSERMEADVGIAARAKEDGGVTIDRHGADEAVVVVGVFADEIDAAGSGDLDEGNFGGAEEFVEKVRVDCGVHGRVFL
jgi:hypothetical protein